MNKREYLEAKFGPLVDRTKVFVVHGRDTQLRDEVFSFLRAIGLSPLEWSEAVGLAVSDTQRATPSLEDVLSAAFQRAQAILVVMSGDDLAQLRDDLRSPGEEPNPVPQARPNVILEAGMALGRSEKRTVIIECGDLRAISDIAGRYRLRMDSTPEKRKELADRLQSSGCAVQLTGTQWLSVGKFTPTRREAIGVRTNAGRSVSASRKAAAVDVQNKLEEYLRHYDGEGRRLVDFEAVAASIRVGVIDIASNIAVVADRLGAQVESLGETTATIDFGSYRY